MSKGSGFSEIFTDPVREVIPVGLRSGDLIHAVRIIGEDSQTGTVPDDLESQLRNAFANMRRSVEYAKGTIDNVAHVTLFLSDARAAMPAVNLHWTTLFPDAADRPTYKFISTPLPHQQLVNIEYFAVLNARRRVISIPGVAHTNPIPMGVRIGKYLFSSRVLPMDSATGSYPADVGTQIERLFENVGAVLSEAGMTWRDVVQCRLFLADMANLPLLEKRWATLYPNKDARPILHPIHYNVGPSLLVMIEIFAIKS